MRRLLLLAASVVFALASVGDARLHASTCTPLGSGICTACKNCHACGHCAKRGGKCSVCR